MASSRYLKRILATLALVGVLALFTGVVLGVGAGRSLAGAAPVGVPAGTLGVGDTIVAPLGRTPTAGDIAVMPTRATAASLTTTAPLAAAPIAKPPARRPAARRQTAARTTTRAKVAPAAATGWQSARASWYGPGFYGRKTASGAVYTQTMLNVAHKSLPFGTRIEFEYGGRTVIAVVNDRGPFVAGRTFDLGAGTAKALGFSGVHVVRYRILGR